MKFVLTSLLFFCSIFLSAQESKNLTIEVSGKIISQKTLESIPFAHVVINKTGLGTVTNQQGYFRLVLPNKYASSILKISSIGFESDYINLSSTKSLNKLTIKLKESTKFLDGVVITPVDEARLLVEEAIQKIETNYPTTKTQLEGFLRGVTKKGNNIAYVTEGVFLVEKNSYTKKTFKGKIKLIKGRTIEEIGLKSLFYGGHHLPHFADAVHGRSSYINKAKTNQYYYEILDSIKSEESTIVRVGFQSKKNNANGVLFINLNNYAFAKISYHYRGEEDENSILDKVRGGKRLYRNYDVEYVKIDSLWYLNLINYNSALYLQNEKDTLSWTALYSTTKLLDKVDEIIYNEEFQYVDITLRNMGVYDSTFWNNYTIVLPSKKIELLFKKHDPAAIEKKIAVQEKTLNKRLKLIELISKMKFTIGVFAQPASIDNVVINYINGTSIITETVDQINFYYTGLSSVFEYYFTPSLFIGLDNKFNFYGNKYSSWSFKTGYNAIFSAFGRPATANFSVNMGYYRFGYVVGKYNVANDLEINGKPFDSEEVQLSLESRRWAVEPTIRLSLEMNHRLSLFVEGGWNVPFSHKDGLYFKEKGQPFWQTKQTFVGLSHPDISLSDGINELTEIPLQTNLMLNVGILIHFKY